MAQWRMASIGGADRNTMDPMGIKTYRKQRIYQRRGAEKTVCRSDVALRRQLFEKIDCVIHEIDLGES
jgi:hypothetical protein